MPELPRDPRQLARDILSGKVRIEDLARQRQLRAPSAAAPPAPPGPRLPEKIPLARTAPRPSQPTYQVPRPLQRPVPPTSRGPAGPYQKPQPQNPFPSPVQRQQPKPPPITIPQPQAYAMPPAPAQPSTSAPASRRPVRIQQLVRSKLALRQGMILAEILAPPVSLRD